MTQEQATATPVLDLVTKMTADSIEASTLDPATLMLVRLAALVSVDAPPVSYLVNIGAAGDLGFGEEEVRGVLSAIAPIVGTARVRGEQHRGGAWARRRGHRTRKDVGE